MKTSQNVDVILPALFKVKQQLKAVAKTSNNPYFKSRYADLNSHIDAVEDLLQENNLLLLQPTTVDESGGNYVTTRITEAKTGQFVESTIKLIGETDMQKVGSAITYGRRYTLGSLLSMKAEDDDGNLASGKSNKSITPNSVTQNDAIVKTDTTTAKVSRPSFRDRNKVKTSAVSVTPVETSTGDDL
jgi:hypothetical protein